MANYPSGAALSIVMLLLSLAVVYAIAQAARRAAAWAG